MVRWGAVGVVVLGLWACDDGGGSGGEDPAPDQAVVDGAVADAGEADARPDAGPAPDAAAPVDAAPADAEPPPDAEVPDAAPPKACDDALGVIPPGLTVLQHDDGVPVGDVTEQPWEIVGVRVGTSELHEAVRFELERPARIHAIQVQYGLLPDGRETPVTLGLYPDFGHNGFDFWAADPYWEGGRCRGDLRSEQWVDYVLPAPIEITEPGLVYVAHRREARRSAAWLFDGSLPTPDCGNDCCNAFANCHSAWNFPTLTQFQSGGQANYAYNGLSTTFPYDYLVRLHVEYLDEPAAEPVFAALPDVAPSNRMAFADVDNDGDDDLLTNGPRLLRNDGGTFVDATEAAGLAGKRGSGVFGDFDNDGCLDLFLFDESYTGPDSLLRGDCQGGFEDVTEASGITDVQAYNSCLDKGNRSPTAAAAWVDLDADGFLDLYLSNFICWDDGTVYVDTVWHSNGDGTFTEWTGQHGFGDQDDPYLAGRGVLPVDADGDGDMDVFVNNYRLQQNLYYRNEGDGTFTEAAMEAGLAGRATQQGAQTWYGHSIGAAFGDLDGDGDLDAIVANLAHPRFWDFSSKTEVLINQGDGTFADIQGAWDFPAGAAGLRYQETHSVPALADFDQDGALDLVISAVYDGRPTDFYWGNGDGTFRLDAWRSGIGVTNGWGHATADVDLDGDVDLAAQGAVYLNQRAHAGHWLQVKVVGDVAANRAALGATVTVEAGGRRFVRFVGGGTGQGCQDSLYLHMGLGEAASVDRISVRFPGAAAPVVFAGPFDADQRLWLYESGNVQRGFAPLTMGLFDRLRRRPRLVDQLAAPALVCADDGQVLEANAAAEALLAAHGLATGTLPAEAWPPLDGAPVAEILMVQAGLLFSRHRLADARWLVLPRPADDPAQTARLFRSAHELLARVIATIAHDLRSPLASLFFNVGVLRRRFADLERAEVEATLDAMSRACELEMKIIGALVERIDADGREGTPLGRLFERIVDLLSPHFRDGTNRLAVEVDEALVVPGASLLLDQIFVNLIGNAVESRPGAVTVRITSERAPGERLVRIRVANDGPPVEGAQRALIFRPFYTTKPTGTGTGLSFAQEAARQLGGDLVLLPNALTTFEVALPVRDDGGDGGDGPPKTHIG